MIKERENRKMFWKLESGAQNGKGLRRNKKIEFLARSGDKSQSNLHSRIPERLRICETRSGVGGGGRRVGEEEVKERGSVYYIAESLCNTQPAHPTVSEAHSQPPTHTCPEPPV